MYIKSPGTLKAVKHFLNLQPVNKNCVLNSSFSCVNHVLGGV